MMMPRSLSGLQSVVAFKVVAWLLPDQPPPLITLVWGSSAPSVIRKTYGSVLFEALPSPTLVISVLRRKRILEMGSAGAEARIGVGVELRSQVRGRVIDRRGIGRRAVDGGGQRKVAIEILNERIETDPELIRDFRAGVGGDEQLVDRGADRVGAQLDASGGAGGGAGCNRPECRI